MSVYQFLNGSDVFRSPVAVYLYPSTVLLTILSLPLHNGFLPHLTFGFPFFLLHTAIHFSTCSGFLLSVILLTCLYHILRFYTTQTAFCTPISSLITSFGILFFLDIITLNKKLNLI